MSGIQNQIRPDFAANATSAAGQPGAIVVAAHAESRAQLSRCLGAAGFRVDEAGTSAEGWKLFRKRRPDLVVNGPAEAGAAGLDLLRRIRTVSTVPVIFVGNSDDLRAAVAAIKAGAEEFYRLPTDRKRVTERARVIACELRSAAALEQKLVGPGAAMTRVRERVRALAPLEVPVLVRGEAGSGRGHVIRCLAELASGGPLRVVTIRPESGRETPAAEAGSVFHLDGVDDFPIAEQARWLGFLRESESEGLRSRVFASTCTELPRLADAGRFDPELAERLSRFELVLPPLRERRDDVGALVEHFAEQHSARMGRGHIRFDPETFVVLESQPWPGNVRELTNVVEKLVAFSPAGEVTVGCVREVFGEIRGSVASLRQKRELKQRDQLVELIEECGGNLAEVARRLDLSRGAVIYRAQKHGLLPRREPRTRALNRP